MAYNPQNINGVTTQSGSSPVVLSNDYNSTSLIKIVDTTTPANQANIAVNNTSASGTAGNSLITTGTGYTTGTVTLNSGTQNSSWYDMLNYAWVSVEILTNTTNSTTVTFQTSGDASQTTQSNIPMQGTNGLLVATTTSTGTFHTARHGRWFRISTNASSSNSVTLVLTFHTTPSAYASTNLAPSQAGGYSGYAANLLTNTAGATTISSTPGKFAGFSLFNFSSTYAVLQVFDTTSVVTLGSTSATYGFVIPANGVPSNGVTANFEIANGLNIANGIKVAATTTWNGSTALSAGGLYGTIFYR